MQNTAMRVMIEQFEKQLNILNTTPTHPTQDLESIIFIIKAFSETISSEELEYSPRLFSKQNIAFIQSVITQKRDGFEQLRLTLASCFGSYAEWLSGREEFLPNVFSFLLHELEFSKHPVTSALALTEMCSLCQVPLSKHCDEVLNLCMTTLPKIPEQVQSKIIQSMLYIIQALEADEAVRRSMFILESILSRLEETIQQQESPEARKMLILNLDFLRSFCKGSRKSVIDLDSYTDTTLSASDQLIGSKLHKALDYVLEKYIRDEEILTIVANVIVECMKCDVKSIEQQNYPFFQSTVRVFSNHPSASVLSIASNAIKTCKPGYLKTHKQNYFENCIQLIINFIQITSFEYMTAEPDVCYEFFLFLEAVF
jgi:hypothetical protein